MKKIKIENSHGEEITQTTHQFNRHAIDGYRDLQSLLQEKQLCDVVLIAGNDGKRIQAHRLVLALKSEYFLVMFTGALRETKEREITLAEIDGDILEKLVRYCYTGNIVLQDDSIEKLLAAASMLQFNAVVPVCCDFLVEELHVSNCIGVAYFAEQRNYETLAIEAKAFICKNFMNVCKEKEFFKLNAKHLSLLLADDDLNVPDEEHIFQCLRCWIAHDYEVRMKYFDELLHTVRLALLGPAFITDQVMPCCTSVESQRMIMETMQWHLLPARRNNNYRSQPRKSFADKYKVFLVMSATRINKIYNMEIYCPSQNKCSKWRNILLDRKNFRVAVLNDFLIITGGCNPSGISLNTVASLNLTDKIKKVFNPMKEARSRHVVAVLKGFLYAVGGNKSRTAERLDPSTDTWSYVANMSGERWSAGVAVYNDLLYVIGGRNNVERLRTMERYDPVTNTWVLMPPMYTPRADVGVAVVKHYIYAVGGITEKNGITATVERYDVDSNKWIMICPLKKERLSVACFSFEDTIVAAGGWDGKEEYPYTEKYNVSANTWTIQPSMPHSFSTVSFVPISQKMFNSIVK